MSRNFFAKSGFLALTLGAIATSGFLNACAPSAQNQVSSPTATGTESQPMHHGNTTHNGANHHTAMELGTADAEFDRRFIDAMTLHHRGAVKMAQEAQQKSKRPEIKELAADIVQAQNKEISQMKQWRQAWYPAASAQPVAYNSQKGNSMPMSQDQTKSMMMSMDLGSADDQFDLRFLNAMITHHEGALAMAKDALNQSKRPEVKKLAQEIIASQEAEIKQMQQWKQAWYKQ